MQGKLGLPVSAMVKYAMVLWFVKCSQSCCHFENTGVCPEQQLICYFAIWCVSHFPLVVGSSWALARIDRSMLCPRPY